LSLERSSDFDRNRDSERTCILAQQYFPLLIFVVVSIVFAAIAIGLPSVLGPGRRNSQKLEPYESGIIPFQNARHRFPIKYYLVAMLFILFDIEVIFLYPWAGVLRPLRDQFGVWITLVPIGFFLLILIVGLVYEWSKGALDWE
jgi:NADH-quinone oxidoreductase subunit A